MATSLNPQVEQIPASLQAEVGGLCQRWASEGRMARLWSGDASLWTATGESDWLGWLSVIDGQLADIGNLVALQERIKGRFSDAVLLGMGGSSLCPEVLGHCFGRQAGYPDLSVVDSTDPAQVQACEESIQIESTLFLSASKSGSTLETSLLTSHFLDRLADSFDSRRAAERFVAITDPGSKLERHANEAGFGDVFHGVPEIGGRYSALSNFGMVPAAVMGLDVRTLLKNARLMHSACADGSDCAGNPGLRLGLLIGAAALAGRDKLTFVCSPGIGSLGTWIEQLVAESTGKNGTGIVPVEGEDLQAPDRYGKDRVFASISLEAESNPQRDAALDELVRLGHPVVRISMRGVESIGQEFFRWEVATAVAGAVLGINPFDQPDVESAKVAARRLTAEYEERGALPEDEPFYEGSRCRLFASPTHASAVLESCDKRALPSLVRSHLDTVRDTDYIAVLAFVRRDAETTAALERIRALIRASRPNATCVGFGPRFLHSTGQLHKGGADNGVFIQIDCDDGPALRVPQSASGMTFGVVKRAQALGDFDVLMQSGRRVMRIEIAGGLEDGLGTLESAFAEACQ